MMKVFKKVLCLLICLFVITSSGLLMINAKTDQAITVGTEVVSIDESVLNSENYVFVDDRDESIIYTWPYDIEGAYVLKDNAYKGTCRWSLGQTGCTITYTFKSTFLAAAFVRLNDAAKVIITIDGIKTGEYIPTGSDDISEIVFVKDDMTDTVHTVVVSLEAAPVGDNLGNNAMFDCFITKKPSSVGKETISLEDSIWDLNTDKLKETGYIFIDDRNADIVYTWPYDIDGAYITKDNAYDQTVRWGLGQTGCTITYTFTGSYIAASFMQLTDAAKVIFTIDGVKAGEYQPKGSDEISKIVFIKDDLTAGEHTIVASLEAAAEGDNLGNNAMFDCFIIKETTPQPPTGDVDITLMYMLVSFVCISTIIMINRRKENV